MIEVPTYDCPFQKFGQWVELGPATNEPLAIQRTQFHARWTSEHLIVEFECVSVNPKATYCQRDEPLYEEDVCEVFVCPSGDLTNYFEFEINPLGALFDAAIQSPFLDRKTMTADIGWDCIGLEGTVAINSGQGWVATLIIPFGGIGLDAPRLGDTWRANFFRIDRESSVKYSAWSPTIEIPANFHVPERFGFLRFTA